MTIQKFLGVENAKNTTGLTVIIDILRASTTAAFLLDKGVKEIVPVSTKEEAFAFKKAQPSCLLVGEERGVKIKGFDFGNSPYEISQAEDLTGKTAVHRSSRGTQALVRARHATQIIFGSFVCATAILTYLKSLPDQQLSILSTMEIPGTEDEIFADYLIAKLTGKKAVDIKEVVEYMKSHPEGAKFLDPRITQFPPEDFYLALSLDRFDFVPLVRDGKVIKYV